MTQRQQDVAAMQALQRTELEQLKRFWTDSNPLALLQLQDVLAEGDADAVRRLDDHAIDCIQRLALFSLRTMSIMAAAGAGTPYWGEE